MATKHPQGSGGPRGDDIPGKYFSRLCGHIVNPHCMRVFMRVFYEIKLWHLTPLNSSGPRPYGRHFAGNIFEHIFLTEYVWISLNLTDSIPKVRIIYIPALVQIMAWRRPGDKPLPEPIMHRLLTHICVNRYNWRNQVFSLGYMCLQPRLTTTQVCHNMRFCVLDTGIRGGDR